MLDWTRTDFGGTDGSLALAYLTKSRLQHLSCMCGKRRAESDPFKNQASSSVGLLQQHDAETNSAFDNNIVLGCEQNAPSVSPSTLQTTPRSTKRSLQ
ncbi:hypothetical protein O9929_13050 [Vibrio lentus]|nr:hypothetical protein [Vibrio lentus]